MTFLCNNIFSLFWCNLLSSIKSINTLPLSQLNESSFYTVCSHIQSSLNLDGLTHIYAIFNKHVLLILLL